jgi:hypothetical protein
LERDRIGGLQPDELVGGFGRAADQFDLDATRLGQPLQSLVERNPPEVSPDRGRQPPISVGVQPWLERSVIRRRVFLRRLAPRRFRHCCLGQTDHETNRQR